MRKTKKFVKIVMSVLCCAVVLFGLAYVGLGLFGSVELSSGACGGGYKTYLVSANEDAISKAYGADISELQLSEIKYNISYEGRTVNTKFTDVNDETVYLTGKMKWFWNDSSFEWSAVQSNIK